MKPIFDAPCENSRRRTCMLMVTHACNLDCVYCYESHKDERRMSFELAQAILRREEAFVQHDPRFDELEIQFMGGEPLMNFDLIRQVVEWLRERPLSVPFICFATTNGTLLDEARKAWFRRHRDLVWLGVSLDGSLDSQRSNRGAAAGAVDFEFFHEVWPEQAMKLTVSKDSLARLAEGVVEAQRRGFRLAASLAQGVDWTDADAELYLAQLRSLAATYLDSPELSPINLLTRPLHGLAAPSPRQKQFCGTGTHMCTYDVDGRTYGCHMFAPIVLGEARALELARIDWTSRTIAEDARCTTCLLKDYCPTCMGFNFRFRGSLAARDPRWCRMVLAEAIASCEFQIRVLASRRDSLNEDEAKHGQSALDAYPLLSTLSSPGSSAPFSSDSRPITEVNT